MREVVGAEGEEVYFLSDFVRGECSARHFDHGADEHFEFYTLFFLNSGNGVDDNLLLRKQFLDVADQRHHDFGTCARNIGGGLANSAHLHFRYFGVGDAEAAPTVTEHRVEFVEFIHQHLDFCHGDAHNLCHLGLACFIVRDEFVQGRIKQTHRAFTTIKSFEDAFKVFALEGKKCVECSVILCERRIKLSLDGSFFSIGAGHGESFFEFLHLFGHEDHTTESNDAVFREEHMLGTAEADTFCAEANGDLCIARRIGIGANAHGAILVGECHDFSKRSGEFGIACFDAAFVDLAGRTVKRDPIAFAESDVTNLNGLGLGIDNGIAATGYAALTHTTSHHCCVGGHAAASGEDALCRDHAGDVFRRCFGTAENNFLAELGPCFSIFSGEDDLAGCHAGRGREAGSNCLGVLFSHSVEYRVEELIKLLGLHTKHGCLFVNKTFFHEVGGDTHGSGSGALAVTGLEHVEFAIFDGELHVLHILVMVLKLYADGVKLLEHFGHGFFEGGILRHALFFRNARTLCPFTGTGDGDFLRGADTGHHVFTLSVNEVFAVEVRVVAGGGVTGESHAGGGIVAAVAENHRLHVYSSAGETTDVVEFTILDGAGIVPGAEHGLDAHLKLFVCINREIFTELRFDDLLVARNDFFKVFGGKFGIKLDALGGLDGFQFMFKIVMFHAHHNVAEHLNEATVAVHHKTLVAGFGDHCFNSFGIETEIEHGIHHAGHRNGCAGTHRNQERIRTFAESLSGDFLKAGQSCIHFGHNLGKELFFTDFIILAASFGGDCETRRHGQPHGSHFCEVGTLATQHHLHRTISFRGIATKEIDVFFLTHCFSFL